MGNQNIDFILDCLALDDDESFWAMACELFFDDAVKYNTEDLPLFIEIGICSRWLKAEDKRFSDSQGQPLPVNSEKDRHSFSRLNLPDYDWSMIFYYDPKEKKWKAGDMPPEDYICLRTALPAKTSNLHHAVGHTTWVRSGEVAMPQLYSFRKVDEKWECIINALEKQAKQ